MGWRVEGGFWGKLLRGRGLFFWIWCGWGFGDWGPKKAKTI
jgi:hypothetical protein